MLKTAAADQNINGAGEEPETASPIADGIAAAKTDLGPGRDLDSRAAIHDAVVEFYREIVFDPRLAPIFEEAGEVEWDVQIPRLIDYWCRVLLGDPTYSGTILEPHRRVHDQRPLEWGDYDAWHQLWVQVVELGFAGPKADQAVAHADKMVGTLARMVSGVTWKPERSASDHS